MPRLTDEQQNERRSQILQAAGRCFTRDGFHRTSMQRICKEAGMSPGALYLYFESKEALIAAMIEVDRAELAAAFSAAAAADDVLAAMTAVGRRYFVEEPRERAMLTLQIWAESARDPAICALCDGIEREVRANLLFLCRTMQEQGKAAPDVDIEALVDILILISDGIFKNRALDENFDGEQAMAGLLAVLRAGLAGQLALPASSPRLEQPA
ncbi:MAG TPA: TetR/AcrR family transcriptional regulator [Geminicoccus sp.]|uniref:TetR/AcrR family transcriptional regulator n=1 Tax=Geminicoccus sp. TaxID=2024832 RepID=UPI002B695C03|nr:TetR/AcrR family transcriptional regulator [Geminicoccus sp.]HWL71107.1 TetR/AcrR family transcriptional regulator [Geminicoccus sp.]